MSGQITIDTREFKKALRQYVETTRKTGAQIVNQRAYNIAGRTMDLMKPAPGQEQAKRTKIKSYMDHQISTRIRVIKGGKNKGKIRRKGARGNQLARVNLIIQKRRAKKGLKGLWGQAMKQAEGKFKQAAQVGVGFLKVPFVMVVRDLGAYQPPGPRMKIATRWGRISIWGNKAGGTVNPAKPGDSPTVSMFWKWLTKGSPGKVEKLTAPYLQRAFNAEGSSMMRHVEQKLQAEANKLNAK